jgi:aryl-alcohol dehydrogenase-like predicted oxidoreductase
MAYRPLAATGMQVSIIGLGAVKLGRNQAVKYPVSFRIPDDREASSLIDCARHLGINLIDTAPAYGNSEERLGQLLKGQRQDWIICSKTGEEFIEGQSSFDFSAQHTQFSVERSLKRLQTDYLDIVLVHSDGNDLDILQIHETFDALESLKKQGKIRAFGMSTKTLAGGIRAAERCDLVMVTYNVSERDGQPVLDYCLAHHKGVLVKKALASGHLVSRNQPDAIQSSLDFVLAHPAVTSAIIGTISETHLTHNVQCALRACTLVE